MPIEVATEIQIFDQEQFHALDKRVMGIVFAVHNEFGRLLDEALYKKLIAQRCAQAGIGPVEPEVRIRVTHGSFRTAFRCTALTESPGIEHMREHQLRLLAHTPLRYIQWANLNHARIEFRTLSK